MNFKDSIGYLIHHLAFTLDSHSDQVLQERFGIGFSQFKILLVLEEQDGISQKKIAEELSQTEASISRQVKILAKKGLVEVEKSFESKRERLVYQTHRGHELAQKSIDALNSYHAPIFESLSEKQQKELINTLRKLTEPID